MYPPPFFYVHSEIIKLQSIAKMDTWIYIGPILMYLVAQSYIENMHLYFAPGMYKACEI